ncbi:tyrosinase family protein [Azospirillum halopraeferens]|uniref:tyrosinase family protein n=1 Tax=Azospirillum halopraeferens TaxID=34010 RepID=UPI0004092B0D|nr:tyrosinase family protein [Azospirillum halopraeferens]
MHNRFNPPHTRRTVLKGGAAVIGLATVGLPLHPAAAATPVRPALSTPEGQAMLAIYEQAVGLMKDPAINNPPQPQSWTFQAYIHALAIDPTNPNSKGYPHGSVAFKAKIDEIYGLNPSGPAAEWKKAALACWSTCPHGSAYFLPWHRWYMYYFEQVIRAVTNRPDFALPYWDYAANESTTLQLPAAFQNPQSPLYESIRGNGFTDPLNLVSQTQPMNDNGYLGYALVEYDGSLVATEYFLADTGDTLFFPPTPGWYAYGYTGRTETQPHDNVHDGVGGLMGNVPTAARDPIFYMHHCQIDHLWASWQSYPGNDTINFAPAGQGTDARPTQADWDATVFAFVDGTGALVTATAPGAVDYRGLYGYDGLAPKPGDKAVAVAAAAAGVVRAAAPGGGAPLAATAGVVVGPGGTTLTLDPAAPAAAGLPRALGSTAAPGTLLLKDVVLETRPPAPLYVFVNLPQGAVAEVGGPNYVGPVNLFKLEPAGGQPQGGHGSHGGHGAAAVTYSYDVAEVLRAQRAAGTWSGGPITVTITTAGAVPSPDAVYLRIGAVELSE